MELNRQRMNREMDIRVGGIELVQYQINIYFQQYVPRYYHMMTSYIKETGKLVKDLLTWLFFGRIFKLTAPAKRLN